MEKQSNENGQIVFMLDLQGTLTGINDELTTIFMGQIEILRKKFGAEKAIVFISSQTEEEQDLYIPADTLKRNLQSNIFLEDCYYFDGTYNPNNKTSVIDYRINDDKIKVLKEKYVSKESNTKFFAIIDDNICIDSLREFQHVMPFVLARPSQTEIDLEEDGFSCFSSCTYGFEGILDAVDRYLKAIKDLSVEQIFEFQKNELFMISGWDISELFKDGNLEQVLAYVENDKVIGMGYHDLSFAIRKYLMENQMSIESNELIKKIAKLTAARIQSENNKRHV